MSRLRMLLITVAAVFAIGAVGASAASAGYFTGTISGSTWLGTLGPCDFRIDAEKTDPVLAPPDDQTLLGSTFTGEGEIQPCDPAEVELSNVEATFNLDGAHWDMILHAPFTVSASGCTFTTSTNYTLHGTANPYGAYSGGGSASGSPFFCGTANLSLSNVNYHDW